MTEMANTCTICGREMYMNGDICNGCADSPNKDNVMTKDEAFDALSAYLLLGVIVDKNLFKQAVAVAVEVLGDSMVEYLEDVGYDE